MKTPKILKNWSFICHYQCLSKDTQLGKAYYIDICELFTYGKTALDSNQVPSKIAIIKNAKYHNL